MQRARGRLPTQEDLRRAVKMAVAASIAWWIGTLAGEPVPVFAALVPLVAIRRADDPFSAVNVSAVRIMGVFVGVGVGLAALAIDSEVTLPLAIGVIVVSLALGLVLRLGGEINVQIAVSALIMLFVGEGRAFSVGVARLWETAIGAVVTLAVVIVLWPPDPIGYLRGRRDELRGELTVDLLATVGLVGAPQAELEENLERVREHSDAARAELADLPKAERSLRLNPVRRQDPATLAEVSANVRVLARLHRHTRSLARSLADAGDGRGLDLGPAQADLTEAAELIVEATDAAMAGEDPAAALGQVEAALERFVAGADDPLASVVALDLRRLGADLSSGARR